jgi:hypothetical protein
VGTLFLLHIEGGIHIIYISLVQFFTQELYGLAKTLEVDYLAFPQEFDYIIYIGIIAEPQNIIVGYPCLLLWHVGI